MKSIIRIYLEYKEDVIRDIEINSNSNLEELHYAIINTLKLDKKELASFYITNNELEIVKEIPLITTIEEDTSLVEMKEINISTLLSNVGDQIIYVYDYIKMWRFLITLNDKIEIDLSETKCIKSLGEMPNNAPEIIFDLKEDFDPFEDAFDKDDYEK